MSDAPAPPTTPGPTPGPAARPRPARRWRRRLLNLVVVVVLLMLAVRIVVPLLLPGLLDGAFENVGLTMGYDDLRLGLTDGNLEAWHLKLETRDGNHTYFDAEYVQADVDIPALLTGRVVFRRIEADGIDARLNRGADGQVDMFRHFLLEDADDSPAGGKPESETGPAGDVTVTSPVVVEALNLHHIRLNWRDEFVTPQLETRLDARVRLSHLASPDAPTRMEVGLSAVGVLDQLDIVAEGRTDDRISDMLVTVRMKGLRPMAFPGYMIAAGLRPVAETVNAAFDASLSLEPAADAPGAVALEARLTDLHLWADDVEHVGLDNVTVLAPVVGARTIELSRVALSGGRAATTVLPDGTLRVAGLDLVGAPSPPARSSRRSPETSAGPAPDVTVADVTVEDVRWQHASLRTEPPLEFDTVLTRAHLSNLVLPTTRGTSPATFDVHARSPGLADSFTLEGRLDPGPTSTLALTIDGRGTAPDALQPYLEASALATTLRDPRFHAALEASWTAGAAGELTASARVHDVALTDGDTELLALDDAQVSDVTVSADGDVHVGSVTVTGTRLSGRRETGGDLRVAGMRPPSGAPATSGPASGPAAAEDEPAPDLTADPIAEAPPSVVIDEIVWEDNRFRLLDEALEATFEVRPRIRIEGVHLGEGAPTVASLSAAMELPGIAEQLTLEGSLLPSELVPSEVGGGSDLALALRGSGLTGALMTPLFEAAGMQRVIQDGALTVDLSGRLGPDNTLDALAVTGIELRDGEVPLLGCKGLSLGGVAQDADATTVGTLAIEEPWIAVRRDAEGGLVFGGFRLPPPPDEAPPDETDTEQGAAPTPPAAGTPAAERSAAEDPPGGPAPPTILEGLHLAGLQVRWTDEWIDPPVETTVQLDVDVGRTVIGAATHEPVPLEVTLTLPESGARVAVEGQVVPDPDDARVSLTLTSAGLGPSAIAAYAGEQTFQLWQGDLMATLEASTGIVEKDGRRLRHGALDLRLTQLTLHDSRQGAAATLDVDGLRLWTERPLALDLEDPERTPPVELRLAGRAPPLVDDISAVLVADLFDDEPSATLEAAVTGVHGAALTDVFPGLAETVDGSTLSDGRFALKAGAYGRGRRRDAYSYDLAGKSFEVEVDEFSFRDGDGPVLAGINGLRVEVSRISPTTGDVRIRSIEITEPTARVRRNERGLEVLGLTLLDPEPPAEDATAEGHPAIDPAADVLEEAPAGTGAASPPPLGPEIRIGSVSVQDLDVVYEDDTTEPPFRLPLTGMQLDVRGFSSHALVEPIPVRVSMIVLADPYDDAPDTPPLFDEVQLDASLALAPTLDGWVRAQVRSLELLGLAGPAAGAGVTINGGTLDTTTDLRFTDGGSLDVSTRLLFTDLDLTEPKDGPIARVLRLPTPTGVVLFVLRDENGIMDLPVDVHVPPGGVTTTEITRLTLAALSSLIIDALANSPFRVLSGVGDAAGSMAGNLTDMTGLGDVMPLGLFGGGEDEEELEPLGAVEFGPADVTLPVEAAEGLDDLARRLEDGPWVIRLGHELGALDIEQASARANPPPAQARALADALRDRRDELQQSHANIVAEIGAAVGAGLQDEAEQLRLRLQLCDEELGNTEMALDYTLDLLRPGAERQALRRTREACQDIATARLEQVRDALLDRLGEDFEERIRVSRPRFREASHEAGGQVSVSLVEAKKYKKGFWSRIFGWLPFVD